MDVIRSYLSRWYVFQFKAVGTRPTNPNTSERNEEEVRKGSDGTGR